MASRPILLLSVKFQQLQTLVLIQIQWTSISKHCGDGIIPSQNSIVHLLKAFTQYAINQYWEPILNLHDKACKRAIILIVKRFRLPFGHINTLLKQDSCDEPSKWATLLFAPINCADRLATWIKTKRLRPEFVRGNAYGNSANAFVRCIHVTS
jgi:hypothetical protein